ncbi:TetR/AcrR family transcriptional regulator [Amaricoccus tamworthensis]|uniref:TetR/AcrR family transcriptional regulator n=1 Tax=Amaricoccus tamworthensis TaxID=57002 RepID=UPI003C7E41F7
MTAPTDKKTHHHGDLRRALVKAGMELIREKGRAGLSLRACAARVGVSHAAPKHHFGNLSGLLGAIALQGFEDFSQTMVEAREKASGNPRDRLIAIAHGYEAFAEENPDLLQLMFSGEVTFPDTPRLQPPAFDVLVETCAPFEPVSDAPYSTEIMIWSLIHGLVMLGRGRGFSPAKLPGGRPSFADILPDLKLRDPESRN